MARSFDSTRKAVADIRCQSYLGIVILRQLVPIDVAAAVNLARCVQRRPLSVTHLSQVARSRAEYLGKVRRLEDRQSVFELVDKNPFNERCEFSSDCRMRAELA